MLVYFAIIIAYGGRDNLRQEVKAITYFGVIYSPLLITVYMIDAGPIKDERIRRSTASNITATGLRLDATLKILILLIISLWVLATIQDYKRGWI